MMSELLALLREGGLRSVGDLARQMDTSPQLVGAMLEELARMGLLERIAGQCANDCGACSLAQRCAAGDGGEIWSLVERADG